MTEYPSCARDSFDRDFYPRCGYWRFESTALAWACPQVTILSGDTVEHE